MFFCVSKETENDMLWQRDTRRARHRGSKRVRVRRYVSERATTVTKRFEGYRQPEGQARHEGCAKRTKQASARTKVRKRVREDATKQDDVDGTSVRIR